MLVLYLKELRNFFVSTSGYFFLLFFFISSWLFLWVFPEYNILDAGYASLSNFFDITPYTLCILIPALTMGLFAEEKRSGTILLLRTSKLSNQNIVMGKYLAALSVIALMIIITVWYYVILYFLSSPIGSLDSSGIMGSFLGLFFLGSFFCSVSLFCASFSKKQIICYLLAAFVCLLIYQGLESIKNIFSWSGKALWLLNLGAKTHYLSISRGVLNSVDLSYFLFANYFFLRITILSITRNE